MTRELEPTHIIATLDRLRQRIEERFPGAGLGRLAADLLALARESAAASAALARPYWAIRIGVGAVVALGLGVLALAARSLRMPRGLESLAELLQVIESGINDAVFLTLAILFLLSLEQRIKRRRALALIHRLRSIAHIVDMHQLTKDPDRLRADRIATASSPTPSLGIEDLGHYLDYCSELLSLTSKVATLLGERRSDPVVLAAINEVELLATGLSTKIWQKLTILDAARRAAAAAPPATDGGPLTARSSAARTLRP